MKKLGNLQNQLKIAKKTTPNQWKNVLGTTSAPKRTKWGGGRMPPEQRWRHSGSIFSLVSPQGCPWARRCWSYVLEGCVYLVQNHASGQILWCVVCFSFLHIFLYFLIFSYLRRAWGAGPGSPEGYGRPRWEFFLIFSYLGGHGGLAWGARGMSPAKIRKTNSYLWGARSGLSSKPFPFPEMAPKR